uniref:7TM_GPCR_Srx domain-containing protein n=1 Tax=Heterorhabditis bacteriophora TaxID=37862 RepID=A0A1I7XFP3_HETBA
MIDIGARLLYDYPSELIGKPIAGQPYTIIKHVLCNGGWFSQLFLLQCVAISHLVEYRNFKMKNVIIICGCIIGTAFITGGFVLLLPNMGFVFNEKSFTWYEDLRYPGMVVHIWYNWIVQAFTLLILTITDIAILWKVITLRLSQTLEQNPRTLSRSDTSKESSIKNGNNFRKSLHCDGRCFNELLYRSESKYVGVSSCRPSSTTLSLGKNDLFFCQGIHSY